MQVRLNLNQQANQYFGMSLHADTFAKNALRVRVANDLDWKIINDLITAQEKNTVANVTLISSPDTTKLSGLISAKGDVKNYSEGFFHEFENPVDFIKSLCDKADNIARANSGKPANPVAVLNRLG